MSAFDPSGHCLIAALSALSQEVGITTCNANGPSRHASSCDPSHRPSQGQRPRHPSQGPSRRPSRRGSAVVPRGHASSVAPIARPSYYRCLRWQPQGAGGSVPLGKFRNHPQKLDPQFRWQIVCVTFVSTRFFHGRSPRRRGHSNDGTRPINSRMGPAVP